MIVPRSRLLVWVAAVALPAALVAAFGDDAALAAALAVGALAIVVIMDAVGAGRVLTGLAVELPAISRLSKDRPGKLELRVRNDSQAARQLRLALPLPRDIETPEEDMEILLPEKSAWSRFSWPCVPRERGRRQLDAAYVEASSPLGFWNARRALPLKSEIRIYPNLFKERKKLAALFLNRGNTGIHAQRQVGKGHEFEKLREYVAGDGFEDIHWKTTAKRSRPITKVYQVERTQEVYVVIDTSRLSARPLAPDGENAGAPILELYLTAALALGLAAEHQGDLFGLLTFSDKVESFVRAKNGHAHYSACRDVLYTLQPRMVSPDFDEVCTYIRLRLRRRTLLVFLTALDNPEVAHGFVKNADLIRQQHLVIVNMLQPPGVTPVFAQPDATSVDQLYERLGRHVLWHNLRELQKILQRRGVRFSLVPNERLSVEMVSQYLGIKQRQLL